MKIPAGIVLYCPDPDRLRENLEAICPQAASVICVDNGSDNREEITRLLSQYPQTILIANESNVGIARALNQICRRAADDGFDYVVTLDQDSVCPADMIASYEEHLTEDAGLLCPVVKDRNHDLGTKGGDEPMTEITECITSASLVNLKAWEAVMKSYAQVAKQYLMVLLYEDKKREKLSSVRRGFVDGRKAVIEKRWC